MVRRNGRTASLIVRIYTGQVNQGLSIKRRVIEALGKSDYKRVTELAFRESGVFRLLISLTYDKKSLTCWRSIEAIGLVAGEVGKDRPEVARSLVQRLLWMMRDESGNNPWSVPEILGEIVRNSPGDFSDIPPIIASFYEEEMLRPGVLRALFRISGVRPDLAESARPLVEESFLDGDPEVRAYGALLAGSLQLKEAGDAIGSLAGDREEVMLYQDDDFVMTTVGEVARKTVSALRADGHCQRRG